MIYEVVLTQEYFGQQVINRFNYLSTGTPVGVTGAFALISAMGLIPVSGDFPADTFGGALQDIQSDQAVFVSTLAKAIREAPTDFFDEGYPTGVTGDGTTTQATSPINAFGFRTNRVRTDIARGTKRFVGVKEGDVDAGGFIADATEPFLADIAEKMTDVLSYTDGGNSLTFAPIVVSRDKTVDEDGKVSYPYYATIAEQLEHIATGIVWQPYDTVRSQVSRQYNHGA